MIDATYVGKFMDFDKMKPDNWLPDDEELNIIQFIEKSEPIAFFSLIADDDRDQITDPSMISFSLFHRAYNDASPVWRFSLRDLCGPKADDWETGEMDDPNRGEMRKIAAALREAADVLDRKSYEPRR